MKQRVLIAFIGLFVFIALVNAEEKVKKWTIAFEAGAGSLLSAEASYMIIDKLDVGLGAGFDLNNFTVGDSAYDSLMLNFNVILGYRIYEKGRLEIQARLKPGFDVLNVGPFSTTSFELTPEVLAGYFNFYAMFSGILMFTQTTTFVPQVGIGYRFRF